MLYIFWKLFFQPLIWHIWRPPTCILWSVRFFVTFWDWTGSINWNLVLCKKWKLFYYQLSWKHHQAARVQKECLEIWKKVKSITYLGDTRGFIAWVCIFSQEGHEDLFMDSIVKRWKRTDWTFVHDHLKRQITILIAEGTKHIKNFFSTNNSGVP